MLLQKGKSLHYTHPDSAIYYYHIIYTDFKTFEPELDYKNLSGLEKVYLETIIDAFNRTGNIYYYNDEYKRSETYYQQSLEIAKLAGLTYFEAEALFDIGYIRYVNNDYAASGKMFEEAYRLYTETDNLRGMYHAMNACGLTKNRLGNYPSADSCFRKALKIADTLHDSTMISDIKIHLGILYCEQEKLEEGIVYFEEALEYYEKTGYKEAVSDALINIGVVLKMVGENERAHEELDKFT